MQLSIKLCQIFANEGSSSIVLNIERAREIGELDYLVTIRLCCEALRALQF